MKRMFLALWLGAGAALLTACDAAAQQRNCAQREIVLDRLNDGFSETRQSIGMASSNAVVETFANLETGTWTITVTLPNGMTCLVASGEGFELLQEELTPAGVQL